MPHGPLPLPARLCLLAWDTTKLKVTGASQVPRLVRAGALTELAQRGLLADVDGVATPTDPDGRTGDPVLDGLLELVEESRPHTWRTWVGLRTRVTLDAVQAQLAADGYLRAEKTRVLGVFPSVEYELDRVAAVDGLREKARQVLAGPLPVDEVSERDAALVALAAAAELRTLLTSREWRQYDERVAALAERSGTATPALRQAVREVRSAVAVAASGAAGN
ncbi:GOLPH3/VPS74 family protein [Streptomyces aurantiacus]|uniref:GOLPH3/VPS74 family protein n=1 Tax=Streptomyces aurantiacus TaxID=47760 RepID=UPI0006E20EC2|nr:GPP34 family phosphoprotein [Streptomyces aurantiacus]